MIAREEQAASGGLGGFDEGLGGDGGGDGEAVGGEELADDGGGGGLELGGGEGGAVGGGGPLLLESGAALHEEVPPSHPEDGAEGQAEGEVVDEAGGADFEHGHGEAAAEGAEGLAGHAEGGEFADEIIFGIEAGVGPELHGGEDGAGFAGYPPGTRFCSPLPFLILVPPSPFLFLVGWCGVLPPEGGGRGWVLGAG